MFNDGIVGPLRCCRTGNFHIHRECKVFISGHIGSYLQVGAIVAGHTFGIHINCYVVGLTRCKRQFNNRCEHHSVVELNHAFGQANSFGAIHIRNAGETEGCKDNGIIGCALILEAERAVFFKNQLIVDAHIHRIAIFNERDNGTVFRNIVEGAGSFGLIH